MGRLFGDATPFPFDVDYLELVRASVQCAVRLLLAQQAIDDAIAAMSSAELVRSSERARLDRVSEAIRLATVKFEGGAERESRVAARVQTSARAALADEVAQIDALADAELGRRRADVDRARDNAARAVEDFLRGFSPEGSTLEVAVLADEEGYVGDVSIATTFGLRATFRLDLSSTEAWSVHRRIGELCPGSEIHLPYEAGWISKRLELQKIKLDRLLLTELATSPGAIRMEARKGYRAGEGFAIDTTAGLTVVREIDDAGNDRDSHVVDPEDRPTIDRLLAAVRTALEGIAHRRANLLAASFEGRPFSELEQPRAIAARLIATVAPMVNEIERRSGANDELILRRDVADGRREEKYVKKAELRDAIMVLPLGLRTVFEPLALIPRSSLTPPPPIAERDESLISTNALFGELIGELHEDEEVSNEYLEEEEEEVSFPSAYPPKVVISS